jgi:DNA-binding transcriptional regulator GbsR (MarR family)
MSTAAGIPAFIDRFTSVLVAAGIPAMPARVIAALHVADSGRLSSAELAERLQISPAAVSGAVRYLTGLALVHKERVPGTRRDYYRMPPDVWHEVMRLQVQVLARWTTLLKEGVAVVGADTPAGARMADYAAFFDFMLAEFPALMARWDARAGHDGEGTVSLGETVPGDGFGAPLSTGRS